MPTRYALEGIEQLKTQIGTDNLKEVSQREEAKKAVKKSFEEKFQVLRFGVVLGGLLTWCSRERINGSSRLFVSRCGVVGEMHVYGSLSR
jgi:hypothetical protein